MVINKIETINEIESKQDTFTLFEKWILIKLSLSKSLDYDNICGFQNVKYFGFTSGKAVLYFDRQLYKERQFILDSDVTSIYCSPDNEYLVATTQKQDVHLICLVNCKPVFKKNFSKMDYRYGCKVLILSVNEIFSEIWLFFGSEILKFSNVSFPTLTEARKKDDTSSLKELFAGIKLETVETAKETERNSRLLSICRNCCSNSTFRLGILYEHSLVVLLGHCQEKRSIIDYVYSMTLADMCLQNGVSPTAQIRFLNDNMNILILDGHGKIVVYNFILGCLTGFVSTGDQAGFFTHMTSCRDGSQTSDLVVCVSNNQLKLINLQGMSELEEFPFATDSFILPPLEHDESIVTVELNTPTILQIKEIKRLDPTIRLQEMLSLGQFEETKLFAAKFSLDDENIYMQELIFLLKSSEPSAKSIFSCIDHIKTFFCPQVYSQVMVISMESFNDEDRLLVNLEAKAQSFSDNAEASVFLDKIRQELFVWSVFKVLYSSTNYTKNVWSQFRLLNYVDIVFFILRQANFNSSHIIDVWQMLEGNVDELFMKFRGKLHNEIRLLCDGLVNQFRQGLCDSSQFNTIFTWIVNDLFPQQIRVAPEELRQLTELIQCLLRTLEGSLGKQMRKLSLDVLKNINFQVYNLEKRSSNIEKSAFRDSRLDSALEHCNPMGPLRQLQKDLELLEKLYSSYNLDINLKILYSEDAISIAARVLDQMPVSDITDNFVHQRLKDFLEELNIHQDCFMVGYVEKLISAVARNVKGGKSDPAVLCEYSSTLSRFIVFIKYITNKQQRLDGLLSFALISDLPFHETLTDIISKETAICSNYDTITQQLKLLLKKSRMNPILRRYLPSCNFSRVPTPKIVSAILARMSETGSVGVPILSGGVAVVVHGETELHSPGQDLDFVVAEFCISYPDLCRIKVEFYLDRLVFHGDETVAAKAADNLRDCIREWSSPGLRQPVLAHILTMLHDIIRQAADIMNEERLDLVMGVFEWLVSLVKPAASQEGWHRLQRGLALFGPSFACNQSASFSVLVALQQALVLGEAADWWTRTEEAAAANLELTANNFSNKLIGTLSARYSAVLHHPNDFVHLAQGALFQLVKDGCNRQKPHSALALALAHFQFALHHYQNRINDEYLYQTLYLLLVNCDVERDFYGLGLVLDCFRQLMALRDNGQSVSFCYRLQALDIIIAIVKACARHTCHSKFELFWDGYKHWEKLTSVASYKTLSEIFKYLLRLACNNQPSRDGQLAKHLCQKLKPCLEQMLKDDLFVSGYVASLSMCSSIFLTVKCKESVQWLATEIRKCGMSRLVVQRFQSLIRHKQVDQPLAAAMAVLCPPSDGIVSREIRHMIGNSSNVKRRLILLSISSFVLSLLPEHSDLIDPTQRADLTASVLNQARVDSWNQRLAEFGIKVSKRSSKEELRQKRLDLMRHPKMTFDLVQSFHRDFNILKNTTAVEYFQQLFFINVNDCNNIFEYKDRVQSLLERAEDIWQQCTYTSSGPKDARLPFLSEIINHISPYHYELLQFVFQRMHSICNQYDNEMKILDLLYKIPRLSAVGAMEKKYCVDYVKSYNLPDPSQAEFISSQRLPFHIIINDNVMELIDTELNPTTLHLYINLYNLLNGLRIIRKDEFNKDILRQNTVRNMIQDFLKAHTCSDKVTFGACNMSTIPQIRFLDVGDNSATEKKVVFLGDSYRKSSSCFENVVEEIMAVIRDVTSKMSFIDCMKEFLDRLDVAEQLMHLNGVIVRWINVVIQDEYCNHRDNLIAFRTSNEKMLGKLRIQSILFQHGLYIEPYISSAFDCAPILVSILEVERPTSSIKRLKDITTTIQKIADLFQLDLDNFFLELLVEKLKLKDPNLDNSMSSECEESILSSSYTSNESYDENRLPGQQFEVQNYNGVQLMSYDENIKARLVKNLLGYLNKNPVSMMQWYNVLTYLRLVHRPDEVHDKFSVLGQLCSSRLHAEFQLLRELIGHLAGSAGGGALLLPEVLPAGAHQGAVWRPTELVSAVHSLRTANKAALVQTLCCHESTGSGVLPQSPSQSLVPGSQFSLARQLAHLYEPELWRQSSLHPLLSQLGLFPPHNL